MSDKLAIQKVTDFMRSSNVMQRFAEVIGSNNAGAYISSVILAVRNSEKLQKCSTESIYVSALRAATLRLSVDPSTGQAHLVPFKDNATLIVGYKGFYDMAVRTGRYRYINVAEIYDGEEVVFDRFSGQATLAGGRKSSKVIGWIASFEMRDGMSKTIYMTVEEIHAHAKKYSKSYTYSDSAWKTNTEAMERKTVLSALLHRWGYLDPADAQNLAAVEYEADSDRGGEYIEAETKPTEEIPAEPVKEPAPKVAKKAAPAPVEEVPLSIARPWTAVQVKARVAELVAGYGTKATVTDDDRHLVASTLDMTLKGDKTSRYLLTRWLLDAVDGSTKGLEPAQVKALLSWQGVSKFGDAPSDSAIKETIAVHTAALVASGQSNLF